MEHAGTPLRDAVKSWLSTFDVLADGYGGCLRDGLACLVPLAEAEEPVPVRDAVLALAQAYDDLRVLAAAGLDLSPDTRRAAVERVLKRFEDLSALVEDT